MNFEREIHEQYQKAYAMAGRCQQKNKKNSLPVCPVSLDGMLDERMVSSRQDLGVMMVPTNLIVGVAETNEQMRLYTKEFLPLCFPTSETAERWRQTYRDDLLERQSREQVICLEYLGKFYVSNGLMQVSVAKFSNLPSICAQVIRIMSKKTESREAEVYFDFLMQYRLTQLYQIQFTKTGFFEELQKAMGKNRAEKWTEHDRTEFLAFWTKVESAFSKSYGDYLTITAADALVILLRKYSYCQLVRMDSWVLARIFQANWRELYSLSASSAGTEAMRNPPQSLQTA